MYFDIIDDTIFNWSVKVLVEMPMSHPTLTAYGLDHATDLPRDVQVWTV